MIDADARNSRVRILVVDDCEQWRHYICSTLKTKPELHIIGEVSDGLEAVQAAQELEPNLILLDIGLPTLNGIEAARRIRKLAPESKIIFLSQESSAEMVREAFSLGARGYVVKVHAESELLTAVNAVLQGNNFASARFACHDFTDTRNTRSPAAPAMIAD
jgi:DNA-binding NarL/FixJ family response regulator